MKFLFLILSFPLVCAAQAQTASGYRLKQTFSVGGEGGWDYIAVHEGLLYASHGSLVNVLDANTGDSLGIIPNTPGVHGIAFAAGKGFTSNGRGNDVSVFDSATRRVTGRIVTGQNPDAIFREPYSGRLVVCNGGSASLTVIDPATERVTATIPVGGKPETAVSDEAGRVFVNLEDKNAIAVVDVRAGKVVATWPLAPAEGPTGLSIDVKRGRLFAGCEKMLVVIDAKNGRVLQRLPIADGCDGTAFDPGTRFVFASCGTGELAIAAESEEGVCTSFAPVLSTRSARTLALDPVTHRVFLPAADLAPAAPGKRPSAVPGTFRILVFGRD